MSCRPFTKEDFAKWNTTSSVFYVPKRLVGKGKIPQLRADFVKAIGAENVSAVQFLPNHKVRVQFKSPSIRVRYEINGLSFRGVTLTPFPAYEEVKSVFVDRAPLQMVDNYLYEALAPYGRVISVQHLTVHGFPNIKTGTRMVSMSVNIPIPAELKVAGFTLAFRYRGQLPTCYVCQEVGHTAKECPKSKKATCKQPVRKQTIAQSASSRTANTPSQQREVPPSTSKETPASSKPPADLRAKLSKAKIWHLCHVFAIPAWASKRITKALWSFFWSGKKDLVARTTVCLPKSRGGFGVIDFENTPLPVSQFSSCNTYRLGQQKRYREPNCVLHFYGDYGPLHWPQTWAQLHITTLDRFVIDLNWEIAHGVLYTGSHLRHNFGMAHIDPQCFCGADEETLEHLFFECRVARIVTGWILFNLLQFDPTANKFTVDELLFGFMTERRRKIPLVIVWMLHTIKHIIWVARCDYRF